MATMMVQGSDRSRNILASFIQKIVDRDPMRLFSVRSNFIYSQPRPTKLSTQILNRACDTSASGERAVPLHSLKALLKTESFKTIDLFIFLFHSTNNSFNFLLKG
jgi:hypothetical protein